MAISQAKKLEIIAKHAKKFASKSASTPILQGVHYAADGSVVVTDRHRLLRIKDAHNFTEPFTAHAVTGAPIDGVYPDTTKVFPTKFNATIALVEGAKRTEITNAVKLTKFAVDIAKVCGDKRNIATLEFSSEVAILSVKSDDGALSYSAILSNEVDDTFETITLNAAYLFDAFNVFKDAGSYRVTISVIDATSPIVISDEDNGIDVLVLPYRKSSA